MSAKPKIIQNALYQLLREEKVQAFNSKYTTADATEMQACDFRGLDLRGWSVEGLDLSNAYFRNADLRGIDFRQTSLEGASFKGANVSGCYFPDNLEAKELQMSVLLGTRVRLKK